MKIKLMPMLAGAIVLGAAAIPFAVNAQANSSGQQLLAQAQQEQRQGKEGKWAKLNLTDAQKQEMSRIKEETRAQMQSILTPEQQATVQAAMQNGQGRNRQGWKEIKESLTDAQKAQMRTLMEQQKARIEALLTDDQKQQLQQMRQEWQQRRQQRQQGN
ncbi:MAG: P pilus assembly/Cpx signaling pathway, periplasmic inhibitor/zinc-resistance associated protein [Cyanobacteriota bacterium]